MKVLSEKQALKRLRKLQTSYEHQIRDGFEHRAASCITCKTPGACCLDEHFVNVHISRLEAAAIRQALAALPAIRQHEVTARIGTSIVKYSLQADGDTFQQTFSCPLFENGTGCLVHNTAKPVACVTHACYEKPDYLPPAEIQSLQEEKIDSLNEQTYGRSQPWLPLPLALHTKS